MKTQITKIDRNEAAPIYVIQSESELLALEAREEVISTLKTLGYLDKKMFSQSPYFNWGEVIGEMSSQSFFSEQKIIDLRFPEAKLGRNGAKMIVQVAQLANLENILIVSLPVDWRLKKAVWFKKLCENAVVVELHSPNFAELPRWIFARLERYNLKMGAEALQYFAQYVDGNLLAAKQEIMKLASLHSVEGEAKDINLDELQGSLSDVSKFSAVDLRSSYLSGDWKRALHIIDRLENEGAHPMAVSWLINDDVNKAMRVYGKTRSGHNENEALRSEKLFFERADTIKKFYKKCTNPLFYKQLLDAEILDLACKNAGYEDPWLMIRRRIMEFS